MKQYSCFFIDKTVNFSYAYQEEKIEDPNKIRNERKKITIDITEIQKKS